MLVEDIDLDPSLNSTIRLPTSAVAAANQPYAAAWPCDERRSELSQGSAKAWF